MADQRLDRGIFRTRYGYRIVLRLGGRLHTKRFPPTYTLDALRQWRDEHQRLAKRSTRTAKRGTFAADVIDYLKAVQAMPSYGDRERDIEAWADLFGERPRFTIHSTEIRTVLHKWRLAGLAASTVNHRRTALGHLYTVLDGKGAANPVRDVPAFREPQPLQRDVPLRVIRQAIKAVTGPKTQARLWVLAWTAMRPSELMRVSPGHVDLDAGTCHVLTGKGGRTRVIALNRQATRAFRVLGARDAWGPFSVATLRKKLVAACRAQKLPVLRVYDLRHSFSFAMRASGADLSDVQQHLGHSTIRLTSRYARAVPEKLRMAVARVRAWKTSVKSQ